MQENTLGKTQQKKFSELYSQEQLENIAEGLLCRSRIINPTDEEVGTVIYFILKAESVYKPGIGNLHPFIYMYVNFAIKKIIQKRKREKKRREVMFSQMEGYELNHPDMHAKSNHDEILELINSKNLLSERQYDIIYRTLVLNEKIPDIAKSYNVTRQYIYSTRDKALEKLQCLRSEL